MSPSAPALRRDDLPRGALFAVLAAGAFAVMAACVKAAAAAGAGTAMVVFFRSAVGLLVLLPWALRRGAAPLRTARPWAHAWRAACGICAVYCFFYAIASLHLSEALVLTYSTPLFIPFIAWAWIREVPAPEVLAAIGVGFAGILLVARPGGDAAATFAVAVGALSSLCAAGAMVGIRHMSDTEPAARIVFWFQLAATVASAMPLPWLWRTPDGLTLAYMVGAGAFATLGQLLLTRAYGLAAAARIGAFAYASVVFGGLIGWLAFGERPGAVSMAGMLLIVACCLLAGGLPRRPARSVTA